MLLPGPEAQQLAIYTGCLLNGVRGGLIAGTIFVLPGLLVMISLSALYVTFGDTSLVNGLFLGLAPAVVALIGQALIGLGRRSLTQPSLILLAVAAFGGRRIGPLERPHRGARAAARHGQHPGRSRRVLFRRRPCLLRRSECGHPYVAQQAVSAWGWVQVGIPVPNTFSWSALMISGIAGMLLFVLRCPVLAVLGVCAPLSVVVQVATAAL